MKFIHLLSIVLVLNHGSLGAQNDLSYYIAQAKANSPLLLENRNLAEAGKIELERIKALYTKAQVTFNAAFATSPIINRDDGRSQIQWSPTDANNYSGYDIAASNGGVYQGMINVTQSLFNASKLRMASEQAIVANQITLNNIRITEHDLEKLVGDQYILCLQDLKQMNYTEDLHKIVADQKAITTKFVMGGILKQSDLLLVTIEEQNQQNILSTNKATYRRDLMDLNILCGLNDTTLIVLQDLHLSLNTFSQSGFTLKFRLDSLNLVAIQKTFELKYKPQFSAFANAGLNGVYLPTLPNRFGVSAGLNFSTFIFDGKQKALSRKRTDLLVKAAQAYRSNFGTQNSVRKTRILSELSSLSERITTSESEITNYRQLLEMYRNEVGIGQQSLIVYIQTVKNLGVLQRDYAILQTNKQLLLNTYNYWNW